MQATLKEFLSPDGKSRALVWHTTWDAMRKQGWTEVPPSMWLDGRKIMPPAPNTDQ